MHKERAKIISLLSLLFLGSLATLGFIYPKLQINFTPQCSGVIITDVSVEKKFTPMLEAELEKVTGKRVDEVLKAYLPANSKLDIYPEKDNLHYRIATNFNNLDDVINPFTKEKVTPRLSLKKENYILFIDYTFKQRINLKYKDLLPTTFPAQINEVLGSTKIAYEVVLPGELVSANTKTRKLNKATWQLKLGKSSVLFAQSRIIRWRFVIVAGTILLILIGWLGVLIIKEKESGTLKATINSTSSTSQ